MDQSLIALLLTTGAGLATALGAIVVVVFRRQLERHEHAIPLAQCVASGAMTYVSFAELIPESAAALGSLNAHFMAVVGFLLSALLAHLVGEFNAALVLFRTVSASAEANDEEGGGTVVRKRRILFRSALFIFVAMSLHNLVEGSVTYLGALKNTRLGLRLALVIGLHNTLEGAPIALSVLSATQSSALAVVAAALSGAFEPIAVLALLVFGEPSAYWLDVALGACGGVMLFCVLNEMFLVVGADRSVRSSSLAFIIGYAFSLAGDFVSSS